MDSGFKKPSGETRLEKELKWLKEYHGMEKEFFEKVREGADFLKGRDDFVVCHHYDADGITSGSIVTKALLRMGKKVKPFGIKQLYSDTITEIKSIGKNMVFTDFGSSYINELREAFGEGNFMVIDHHQKGSGQYQFHVNPMEFGIEGGSSISSSGIAYLTAKAIDQKNMDLAGIGIVGAVGDMQDFNTGKLVGLNESILMEDGIQNGVLNKKIDLRLYGRISRPLTQFLMYSTSPLLPMLTGNEENCIKFLHNNQIPLKEGDSWNSYEDLSPEDKKNLSTALILHLNSYNVPEWKIKELIGEVYTLVREEMRSPLRDAKEFSTVLNACGRNKMSSLGLQVCLGDRGEYYGRALGMLADHRKNLAQGIQFVKERGLEEMKGFYFFDATTSTIQESIVGIIAGMLYSSGIIQPNKPIIAFAKAEDGNIKVSGRATTELTRRGVNLGKSLKEVCGELSEYAEGGGHVIAAGCRIKIEEQKEFLEKLNESILKSISST